MFILMEGMQDKRKLIKFKILGGKKITLVDEDAMSAFNSYYPDWNVQLNMVPTFLIKEAEK